MLPLIIPLNNPTIINVVNPIINHISPSHCDYWLNHQSHHHHHHHQYIPLDKKHPTSGESVVNEPTIANLRYLTKNDKFFAGERR